MDRDALIAAVEQNYVGTWRLLGEVVKGGEVRSAPTCVASGARIPFFNPAFMLEEGDPEADLAAADDFFSQRGLPYMLVFRDGVNRAGELAAQRGGFARADSVPGMAMWPARPSPSPRGDALDVIEVTTPAQHDDYLRLFAESFEIPLQLIEPIFTFELARIDGFTEFLGLDQGRPVAGSGVTFVDGVAGVYNVVTTPSERGRGLGAQMTWHATQAGWDAGCTVATLQSSTMGFGVYERMGFEQACTYHLYTRGPEDEGSETGL